MAGSRSLRRTSPLTLILGVVLLLGFLFYFFSGSSDSASPDGPGRLRIGAREAAQNILSPPSLPFRRLKGIIKSAPAPPVVHYHLNNITTSANAIANRETVLILTPLSRFYKGYFDNLQKLSYPHELISVGFIIPKDAAGNAATKLVQEQITRIQALAEGKRFASVTILRQDFDPPIQSQDEAERHKMQAQKPRRAAMAKARNSLLFTTLGPTTSWVLWLDSDIVETPPSIIQDLASHDKPIIVPNCYQRYFDKEKNKMDVRPYDYNSWIDSDFAIAMARSMPAEEILLEGYSELATYRTLMAHMYSGDFPPEKHPEAHNEVELDGVGGTALLVKADVHRDGAMFPPFSFYHLIETEGFAKMAKRLGWQSWGLPNYFVYHYDE